MHGIAKAGTLLPDVIAVDFGRTRQDVVDMCFLLKRQDATKHIAIIAVTEVFTSNEIELAMRAGCASVLTKPCRPEVLFDEIRRVLAAAEPDHLMSFRVVRFPKLMLRPGVRGEGWP